MKSKRTSDRSLPATSFKVGMKAAVDKVMSDISSGSSQASNDLDHAKDLLIGFLVVRILEESPHWQKTVGVIANLWREYNDSRKESGFQSLIRKLVRNFNTGDSSGPRLNLLMRFADAVQKINLSDTTWSWLIEDFAWKYQFSWNESVEENGSIGPEVLAWTNEYLSTLSNQKTRGVFYTSKDDARLIAQLALGHWLEGHLAENGNTTVSKTILPSLLAVNVIDPDLLDSKVIRQLNESLCQIRIIDPACGCGTLLVEMFELLLSVIEKISEAIGIPFRKEETGRSIIEQSLFGFDTESRAIAIAEARLWFCVTDSPKGFSKDPIKGNLIEKDGLLTGAGDKEPENGTNHDLRARSFDIVIGNPPFVRHESINSPAIDRESYLRSLRRAVKKNWPGISTNGRADLHTFFFYLGISMLRSGGVICYISPNAWLDVDYGEQLRSFLLRQTNLRLLLNPSRRRFTAGVNTLIVVASITGDGEHSSDQPVLFLNPGLELSEEDILSAVFNSDSPCKDQSKLITKNDLRPIVAAETKDSHKTFTVGRRWSLYFRAPDIFFDLVRKLDNRLKPLGTLGKVRYPLKTGINEFFFLTADQVLARGIENEYLVPVVKSTKEFTEYQLKAEPKTFLFCCDKSLPELKALRHRGALDYIKWGESQSTKLGIPWPHVASVSQRKEWYAVPRLDPAHILCNRFFDRRFFFGYSTRSVIEDQTFYGLTLNGGGKNRLLQAALLNSSLSYLLVELFGRVSLGEGVLQYAKYEMDSLPALDARELSSIDGREIISAFTPLSNRSIEPIFTELSRNDRQQFDLLIGRKIGLTKSQVQNISSALIELVRLRLDKASSIT